MLISYQEMRAPDCRYEDYDIYLIERVSSNKYGPLKAAERKRLEDLKELGHKTNWCTKKSRKKCLALAYLSESHIMVIYKGGKPYAQGHYYTGYAPPPLNYVMRSRFFDSQNQKLRLDLPLILWGREYDGRPEIRLFFADVALYCS